MGVLGFGPDEPNYRSVLAAMVRELTSGGVDASTTRLWMEVGRDLCAKSQRPRTRLAAARLLQTGDRILAEIAKSEGTVHMPAMTCSFNVNFDVKG